MKKFEQIASILWIIAHYFLVAVISALVRYISGRFPVIEIIFFANLTAFLIMAVFIFIMREYKKLKTTKLHLHFSRALFDIISITMYCYAFTIMPLVNVRAIALTTPIITLLLAVLFLKEKLPRHRIIALTIGFFGAVIIICPGSTSFSYVSLMVIATVILWALTSMIIKVISRTETKSIQLFYLHGLMALLSLPGALFYGHLPQSTLEWIWLAGIGLIFLLNLVTISNSYKSTEITVIMPFDFIGMVFTIIIAYFGFNEVINTRIAIGAMIVVISSVYLTKQEIQTSKVI